jgi:hypothetical protein
MFKNMFRIAAGILSLLLLSLTSMAGVLKGKVKDTRGEELPFAVVFIQGTTSGTSANANAEYQLTLQPGTHKVVCQYIGFSQKVFTVNVKGDETITHDFVLEEQSLKMKEVVVKATDEDPAYAIIRKAIARRSFHLSQIKSFQSSIYMKGVLRMREMPNSIFGIKISDENGDKAEVNKSMGLDSNGKGVVYLVEENVDYISQGDKEKTYIRSVRENGDPNGFGISKVPPVISFYENNVKVYEGINPRGFVSPIADNAIHYYKYKYEGEFRENGHVVNKITVTPRRLYEPLVTGTIYIVEDDWAIHSLDLYVTQKSNLEILDTLMIKQSHLPLKKDTWVVKSQVIYPTAKILGINFSGHFLTVYDKQKVNELIHDSVFNGKIESTYDKEANKRDTSYWAENRPTPLEEDEYRDYLFKDSVRKRLEDPNYRDSMRRRGNRFGISGLTYRSKGYKHGIYTNGLLNGWVNYNTVEGINVAPRIWWEYRPVKGKTITTTLAPRYGFSNEHFNAMARISYTRSDTSWHNKRWKLSAEGGSYVFQFNPESNMQPLYNTFSTLVYGYNYMKLYEAMRAGLNFDKDHGNGWSWNINARFEKRLLLYNTTDYTFIEKNRRFTPNMPAIREPFPYEEHNAALVGASISYQPGMTYTQYPDFKVSNGSNWPVFTLEYQKGIPSLLDSKTDFDKWRIGAEDYVNLNLFGFLRYNVSAGGFLNDNYVPAMDMKHLNGNRLYLAAPYLRSFQLAPYYLYSNTERLYGQAHVEYYLKGLLTNKIPLLRQAKWYLVLGTNTFYAGTDKYYAEAFAGVDNLGWKWFRFLRVDFVRSWDNYNRKDFAIRAGINLAGFGGAVSSGNQGEKTDW